MREMRGEGSTLETIELDDLGIDFELDSVEIVRNVRDHSIIRIPCGDSVVELKIHRRGRVVYEPVKEG